MILRPLEFEAAEPGHCCELCNPQHVADYETRCVPVRAPGGNRVYFCLACVRSLARAARGTVGTNQDELQHWRDLETGALCSKCGRGRGRHYAYCERRNR